jgi:hypothetical protein
MPILIKMTDGTVRVMALLEEAAQAFEHDPELVVSGEIKGWPEEDQKAVASWRVVSEDDIPKDRTFRNAWCDVTPASTIDHDMIKCRGIWKDKMRAARKPLIEAADIEFMRAMEAGAPTADISTRKQALRDVTANPAIDKAKTPEELKTVWPACLTSSKG